MSSSWFMYRNLFFAVILTIAIHYAKMVIMDSIDLHYYRINTHLETPDTSDAKCDLLYYELLHLKRELNELREKQDEWEAWKADLHSNVELKIEEKFENYYSDQIGLLDYAAVYAGGSIISTPETVPYPSQLMWKIFGMIEWKFDSEPTLILQQTSSPLDCFVFHGDNGRIRVKLGRAIVVTNVTLEHFKIARNKTCAPKDFQVLGFLGNFIEVSLGNFTYDLNESIIQTFKVESKQFFESIELRILSNHGNREFTCVYRFRVHSLFE